MEWRHALVIMGFYIWPEPQQNGQNSCVFLRMNKSSCADLEDKTRHDFGIAGDDLHSIEAFTTRTVRPHSTTKKVFFLPSVFPASLCLTWTPSEEVSLQTSCARAHQHRVDTVTSQSAPGRSRPPDATLCCSSVVRRRGRRRCLAIASCSTFERFEQCSEEPCTCNNPGRSKCFFRCIFGTTPSGNRNDLAWRRHGMVSGGTRLSCVGVLQRLGNVQGKSARGHFFLWIPRNADTRSLLRWPTEACQWTSKNDFWSLLDPSFGLLPSWLL